MTITGRLTADAVVTTTKGQRRVVNFSLAINDRYITKQGDVVKVTTYYNCAYWISEKLAAWLKKATLVEVIGRLYVTPYLSSGGELKASLNCHVSHVKILAWPKDLAGMGRPAPVAAPKDANDNAVSS